MHESSTVKNLDVSTGGGALVDSDSLVDMSSLEDVTPICRRMMRCSNYKETLE